MRTTIAAGVVLALAAAPLRAQDMPLSQILIEGEGWRPVKVDSYIITSLAANRQGQLFVADPYKHKVHRLGSGTFWTTEEAVFDLSFGADGALFGAEHEALRIVRFDDEGRETPVVSRVKARHIAVLGDKTVYCSVPDPLKITTPERSQTVGHIVRARLDVKRKDGRLMERRNAVGIDGPVPGPLVLWPDRGHLVVGINSEPYLWTFTVDEKDGGGLGEADRYYSLRAKPGEKSCNTSALVGDVAGRLYAATDLGVQVFDPTGRLCGVLTPPTPEPPTAMAFGGSGFDELYVAHGQKLYVRKLNTRGVPPGGLPPKK